MMNRQRPGLPGLSLALFVHCQGREKEQRKSRERMWFSASLPWQRSLWALGSVSTVALSSTQAM